MLAIGCSGDHGARAGRGLGADADDGVASHHQRGFAFVARLLGIVRQGQRDGAADLHGGRQGVGEQNAGHGSTLARRLPSEKCATIDSPTVAPVAETTGLPQRLPSGLATMA